MFPYNEKHNEIVTTLQLNIKRLLQSKLNLIGISIRYISNIMSIVAIHKHYIKTVSGV